MTNKPLTPRAQKALTILEAGGQFCQRLETDSYTGRAQFKTRLHSNGLIVKGFGDSTMSELASMLRICSSTSVSTYYALPYVKAPEPLNADW